MLLFNLNKQLYNNVFRIIACLQRLGSALTGTNPATLISTLTSVTLPTPTNNLQPFFGKTYCSLKANIY